ncbi:hypothetical protein [Agromyces neolithicus]|uniref:Uncharacterized protein n=1 Tax=Agromyces neolithicus TaxID=269420 RepID=A0ABN2MAL3_9MICO
MTSSQEPPLTRREMRERERLLEQQGGSSTPESDVPAAPAPVPYTPPAPVTPPAPANTPVAPAQPAVRGPATAPTFAPPRPGGGIPVPQGSPFGGPAAAQAPVQAPQHDPFSPRPAAPADPTPSAPLAATTPERTLTRRELRAMLGGGQLDEFDDEVEASAAASPPAAAPMPAASTPVMPAAPAPAMPAAPVPSAPVSANRPQPEIPPVVPATNGAIDAVPGLAAGHWTSQLNVPIDEPEPFDQLLSRGALSHGVPTTTNALILPSLPDQGPLGNQITSAGEIIATGSIDLPRSYGATGVHPSQIDSSDVDRLFDHVEDVGTGVAPVAATRAISTQGASRAMIAPPKKEGMNVPLVLAVTAGVLALGVVATLVIGAVAGLF